MLNCRSILIGCELFLILFFVRISHSQETDGAIVLDIETAIEMAMVQNPNLKIANDREKIAEAQIKETSAGALPQLTFSSNYTRNIKKPVFFFKLGDEVQPIEIGSNNAYIGNISFQQMIFENGQLGLGKARRIAHLFSEVMEEGTELTKDKVILNVHQAFYTVLLSQQVVSVFQETLAQTEAHYKNVHMQYEHGVAAEFDLIRSEVQVAEAKAALIEAENGLELAKNGLKNAIGLPLERKINLMGSLAFEPISEEEILEAAKVALHNRPEMKQLRLQEEIARLNIDIQRGRRLPSLTLNGNYQFQGQSDNFQFGPMERSSSFTTSLDLRLDIFNGFETSARIQKSELEFLEILHQKEQVNQIIKIEIRQATLKMKAAQERIEAQQKSVRQAEKAYQIAEVRYNSGIGTQLELFDARLALNRIKTNYLRAIYDYNIALFEWKKAVGIIQ